MPRRGRTYGSLQPRLRRWVCADGRRRDTITHVRRRPMVKQSGSACKTKGTMSKANNGAGGRHVPKPAAFLPLRRRATAGLARGGLVDVMVLAPSCGHYQHRVFDGYRIFAPPATFASPLSHNRGSTRTNSASVHKSHTGDVVAHYFKLALGKLGVTFAVDVEPHGNCRRVPLASGQW